MRAWILRVQAVAHVVGQYTARSEGIFWFGGKYFPCQHVLCVQGASLLQAATVSILTVLLYTSRAVYNFIAISYPNVPGFNYGWTNVSDQADQVNLDRGYTYIAFGIVLLLWEFLPTIVGIHKIRS